MPSATAIAHQLLPLFRMLKAERCLPDLLWLEERREETDFPSEAEERIHKVLVEAERVIEEAKRSYIQCYHTFMFRFGKH